jgi:ABC-type thiamine transport system ATPase subunit
VTSRLTRLRHALGEVFAAASPDLRLHILALLRQVAAQARRTRLRRAT